MKSLLFTLLLLCISLSVFAQQFGFTYQAVALDESKAESFGRDSKGQVLLNKALQVRFSIHEQSAEGAVLYQEVQETTTDIFGIFRVVIGAGEKLTGVNLENLQWSDKTYFVQVEIDLGNGFINMGTELIVVPPFNANNSTQLLNLSGTQLAISNGNSVDLSDLLGATRLNEAEVDAFVANNGYLLIEVDGSVTNELQSLSSNGAAGHLAISQGNELTLNVNDADADPTNEIQDLQLTGSQLTITNNPAATSINLSPYLGNNLSEQEVDNMVSNNGYLTEEIQDLNLSGNTLSITNNVSATNISLSPYLNVFETSDGITSNENGDYANDDFVFGSPGLTDDGDVNHASRFFFDKSSSAFRAGYSSLLAWDESLFPWGNYSFGSGYDPIATGLASIALGYSSGATGNYAIAMGNQSIAGANSAISLGMLNNVSGQESMSLGNNNLVAGTQSFALGNSNQIAFGTHHAFVLGSNSLASAPYGLALGHSASASGEESTAIGLQSAASGLRSIALGYYSSASAQEGIAMGSQVSATGFRSTALGFANTSSGQDSRALGTGVGSLSYGETALGLWNTSYTISQSGLLFNNDDRLLSIGNGQDANNRSDALVMLKNGDTRLHGQLTIDADNVNGAGDDYTFPGQRGVNGQVMVTNESGVLNWSTLPLPTITTTANVSSNANGNYATDDFVFGSPQLADDNDPNHDKRMFFDKNKAAFRFGWTEDDSWDDSNVGFYSFAGGYNSRATGVLSFSFGWGSNATAQSSFAVGQGNNSLAFYSSTLGIGCTVQSTAVSGFAAGANSTVHGESGVVIGNQLISRVHSETVFGRRNTDYTPTNSETDRLFVIGNQFSSVQPRSDALVMLRNGNTRLHGQLTIDADNVSGAGGDYTFPGQRGVNGQVMVTNESGVLSWSTLPLPTITTTANVSSNANGNYATDDFVFGSTQLDHGVALGYNRMFFDKSKSAIRAGYVSDTRWDDVLRGQYSTAFGNNTQASGHSSSALGNNSLAVGDGSVALGLQNQAIGASSFSAGEFNYASGDYSSTMGRRSRGYGNASSAIGHYVYAQSFAETALGTYNTEYIPNSLTSNTSSDRLFVLGNGTSTALRSDALVMLKSGNTRLHGQLTIDADNVNGVGEQYTFPGQDGAANQVMTTDGNGNVSWSTPATLTETDVDNFVSNNGYLTTEVDGSITNEIQDLSLTGNTLLITNNAAPTNIDLTPYQNVFETTNGITSNENGNYATDDFVFGSPQLADDGNANHRSRMFFDKSKAAFRVGSTSGNQWDDANVGSGSIGLGINTTASGSHSFAGGRSSEATGSNAVAIGYFARATGSNGVALGNNSAAITSSVGIGSGARANGSSAISLGGSSEANATNSIAIGTYTVASGNTSIAFGHLTNATFQSSIAIGHNTNATATGAIAIGPSAYAFQSNSNAIGNAASASGVRSTALGNFVTASSFGEMALGIYNSTQNYSPNANSYILTDRLFVIGNGTSGNARSNALVMLKNGNTRLHGQLTIDADNVNGAGEEYTLPGQDGAANQVLTTDGNGAVSWQDAAESILGRTITIISNENGNYATDSFVIGSPSLDDDGDASHDTRMFFEKSTGAFRAGTVEDAEWNAGERGINSVAMGNGNIARGDYAVALGLDNLAHSASSVAIGTNVLAEGYNSIALGRNVATTGLHSMALSFYSAARSFGETTMGMFATDYIPNATQSFDANDRLFTIGNGTDDMQRSNALVILKNGDATLLGTLTDASDVRLKRNIKPLQNSLLSINNLQGVHYQWNGRKPQDTLALQTGLIAQEVEKIFPELVKTDEEGFKSVNYLGLVPHLIEAVKELKNENEQLRSENVKAKAVAEQRMTALEAKLTQLEALLTKSK